MAEEQAIDKDLSPVHILAEAFRQDSTEDQRLAAMNVVNQKAEQDKKFGSKATETQWAPLIFSVLSRNYEGALNALNGGRTTFSDAIGPDGKVYKQERNSRGSTGNYWDYVSGEQIAPEKLNEIQKNGWLISKEDMTASQAGVGKGAFEGAALMRKAPFETVVGAYKKAQDQAIASSGIANQYDELLKIAARSRDPKTKSSWLDVWHQLPAQKRAELAAAANVQTQSSTGASRETGATAGTSAGNQATNSVNKNVGLTTGFGGAPNPVGANGPIIPGIQGSVGQTNAGSNAAQTGTTTGTSAGASTSASSGANVQAQFRNILEGIFQKNMGPAEVSDFQRFVQLTTSLENIQKERNPQSLAPGAEAIGELDPLMSGQKNTAITAAKGMKNEALIAEWAHFQADKMNSKDGRAPDLSRWSEEFKDSEVYKAINYRFNNLIAQSRGEDVKPKIGDVSVNNRNKLIVYVGNGKWEDK